MRRGYRLPAGLVLAVLLAGCGGGKPESHAVAPTPVRAVTIGGEAVAGETASFAATIRRDREATLSFRLGGTVRVAPVRIGQQLGAGALVASLDSTAQAAAVARAAAEVDRLERAAGRYAGLVGEGAVSDAQARDARDALAAARAGLAAARYDLASARVVMPFAGTVIARQVEVGETVGPGQAIATVADRNAPWLAAAQVPPAFAARLRAGASVMVEPAGLGRMAGRVLRVAGGSDPRSGTVAVEIALPPVAGLASGTSASARFAMPGAPKSVPTVLVPAEALLEARGDTASVYVIEQGRARRRAVGFAGFADQSARISGLAPGTRVITAGAGFVADGDAVTVSAL